MSHAEPALAFFADEQAGQLSDRSAAPLSASRDYPIHEREKTWAVRRAIVRARCALINMRLDEASRVTARLKQMLSVRGGSYYFRYACALRMLESGILAAEGDFSASRAVLMSVASRGSDTAASSLLRFVIWKSGVSEDIDAPDPVDYLAAPIGGKALFRILSLCVSADLAFERVLLAVSANLATEALQLARKRYGNHSPMSTLPATLLAQVAYEQGRFEEAEALLRPRMGVIRASGFQECAARASVLLARLSLHCGRHRMALEILRETEALGRTRRWPRLVSIAESESARTLATLHCTEGQPQENPRMTPRPGQRNTGAALLIPSPDGSLSFSVLESALRQVCSTASVCAIDDSCELLIPWLRIGAARGLRMTFMDAGRPLTMLLERLYHESSTSGSRLSDLRPFVATLLRSSVQSNTEKGAAISYRPLSGREIGILQMISHGMSNKRIAQSLGITPETVKSHAKNIFIKLATRTRAQAVARAEAIGFL